MEPSLTVDAASLITWSLSTNRKTCFFTGRLGLPQPESNKNQRGWTSFEGDLAPSCKALYESILDIRKVLLGRLKTKQGVRVAGDTLIAEVTEPLLAEHGATIWSESPPFSTVIDIWNYPKYLKHNNSSDRERIMLYLYCWIIGQMFRNPSGGRRVSTRTCRVNNLSDVDDNDDESYVDAESVDTDVLAGLSTDRAFRGTAGTNLGNIYLAPVAQMLPSRTNSDATMDRPGRPQRATTKTALEPASINKGPAQVPNDSDDNLDLYLPPSPPSQRIKRRGYSTQDREVLQNKKQKQNEERSANDVDALALRPNRQLRGKSGTHGSESYPSPPAVQPDRPTNVAAMCNFPNVTHTGQIMTGRIDAENFMPDAQTFTEDAQIENTMEDLGSEYGDSVLGTEDVLRMGAISSKAILQPLNSIVPPKVTDDLRRPLASNLLDIILVGLDQRDILLISKTVDMLESVSKADRPRLQEVYADDFNSHITALDQLVQGLKYLTEYCKRIKFQGSLSTLDAFLTRMPNGTPVDVLKLFREGSSYLSQWNDHEQIAGQIASVLSNLVRCPRRWCLQTMEPLILKLIKELLAWFDV